MKQFMKFGFFEKNALIKNSRLFSKITKISLSLAFRHMKRIDYMVIGINWTRKVPEFEWFFRFLNVNYDVIKINTHNKENTHARVYNKRS